MTHYTESWKEVSSNVISRLVNEENIRFNHSLIRTPEKFRGYTIINNIYVSTGPKNRLNALHVGYSCNADTGTGTREDSVEFNFKYFMDPEFVVKVLLLGIKSDEAISK